MPIQVWNPTDKPVYLKSFDGDSIHIGPKAKGARVANKFGWQVPTNMKVVHLGEEAVDPTKIVRGRTPHPARKPPRAHNKANDVTNTLTAKQMRDKVAQKKAMREAAAQRTALAKSVENP